MVHMRMVSCIPRLYAAASLKRTNSLTMARKISSIPRLYAAASLKQRGLRPALEDRESIPRLYAAASLKLAEVIVGAGQAHEYSAALCRGLIEALFLCQGIVRRGGIPRLYAAASLKP